MSNKSIVIQLNQSLHKTLKGMLDIAYDYIDRYFDPKYEAQIISNSLGHFDHSDELVLEVPLQKPRSFFGVFLFDKCINTKSSFGNIFETPNQQLHLKETQF
jgi:hypothetical protein